MKIQTLAFIILLVAFVLTICRDPAGRVAVIVFITGLGEFALGLAAVMALFQTVGSIGLARDLLEHAEAFAATLVVLAIGTAAMTGWLFIGVWCVQASIP